jgi:hypothetical protein
MNVVLSLVFVFSVFSLTAGAEHDHSEHVDTGFIKGEARRFAWLPVEELKTNKDELVKELDTYEEKYETYFLNKEETNKDNAMAVWEGNMRPKYRKAYDRLLILSAVCFDVYNDQETCMLNSKDLENKYDGRSRQFLTDFKREI